jgi:hypothetical protein
VNAIRRVVGAAGGTALVTLLAGFGMPGLSALVFLVTSALAMTCWILASPDRSDRICRMLLAGRGDPRCLTSGPGILPPEPAHPPVSPTAPPTEQSQAVTHDGASVAEYGISNGELGP